MGEESSSGWARWGGADELEGPDSDGLDDTAASAEEGMSDGEWLAVAPGVRVRAEASGRPAGGAGAGSRWGIAGSREGDGHGGGSVGSVGSDMAPGRSPRSGSDGTGPEGGGHGGLRRVGAVLGAAALIVALVRIAAALPIWPVPTTSALPAVMASVAPAATDPPVGASVPAAVTDPVGTGPTEWVEATAPGSPGPTPTPGGPDPDPPTELSGGLGAESPTPIEDGPVDWWSVLAQLDQSRASALAAREVSDLDAYTVPGSPAWEQDAGLIGDLHERGLTPVGLTTRVVGMEEAPEEGGLDSGTGVELVIVDERSAYSLVDDDGAVIEQVPVSGLRRWRITLVGSDLAGAAPGWRLRSVEALG